MILLKKTRNEINITQPCLLYYILFVTIDNNTAFIWDFCILNEEIVKDCEAVCMLLRCGL